MKLKNLLTTVLALLIAACTSSQLVTDVPSPVPLLKNTVTEIAPHSTLTLISTKTPFPKIQPTNTIPIATLNVIATTDALRLKLISQFPDLDQYNTFCTSYCSGTGMSPNGEWIYFSNGSVMELFHADGRRVGKYSFYDLYGSGSEFHDGYLSPVLWSRDGRYLYLAISFGEGGPGPYFGYKASLARVNLENGTWKDTGISGVFSFSPTETHIIYSTNITEIRVRDLHTGEEVVYFAPTVYPYFGEFVWSPDHEKVIFVGVPENWDVIEGTFALFMFDIENHSMTIVYENALPFYYPLRWIDESQVLLKKDLGDEELILDLSITPPAVHP